MTHTSTIDTLTAANQAFARRYAGEAGTRQPVHTVYGGAQLFDADTISKVGGVALRALGVYAAHPAALGEALGIEKHPSLETIHQRVFEKLTREAVEDYRVDFEDGYGNRGDATEDAHAAAVGESIVGALASGTLSPFIGIRIKPLNEEMRARAIRTLEIVLKKITDMAGDLPNNFIVTVPKITILEQVEYFVTQLERLERELGIPRDTLKFEVMVETPQIILDGDGRSLLPRVLNASNGRLSGAHFGTYDYTAGVGITAAHQRMRHPACDFAKHMMQVAFAGTGVALSDGSTTVLPVPLYRHAPGEPPLQPFQSSANRAGVHRAWKLHFEDIQHSLIGGFYQGWDLHPAQLVSRYAALYAFFLEGIDAAGARLKNFVEKAAQATLVGDVFDDAATGQGLLNFFLRGINSAAITEDEAERLTGVTVDEFRERSFVKILKNRGNMSS